MSINYIPNEIKYLILKQIGDPETLCNAAQVSKQWEKLANSSNLWQNLFLKAYGVALQADENGGISPKKHYQSISVVMNQYIDSKLLERRRWEREADLLDGADGLIAHSNDNLIKLAYRTLLVRINGNGNPDSMINRINARIQYCRDLLSGKLYCNPSMIQNIYQKCVEIFPAVSLLIEKKMKLLARIEEMRATQQNLRKGPESRKGTKLETAIAQLAGKGFDGELVSVDKDSPLGKVMQKLTELLEAFDAIIHVNLPVQTHTLA